MESIFIMTSIRKMADINKIAKGDVMHATNILFLLKIEGRVGCVREVIEG